MHGGAHGSGAPCGERNGAWRHGRETNDAIAARRKATGWLAVLRAMVKAVEAE